MSNDELATAIAYASQRMREMAPGEVQGIDWLVQLRGLLAVQLARAKQSSAEA